MEKESKKRIIKYLKNLLSKIFFVFTNEASVYYKNRYINGYYCFCAKTKTK